MFVLFRSVFFFQKPPFKMSIKNVINYYNYLLTPSLVTVSRPGPSRHQVRFFSDQTPPPVPKKKLARTLSLPTVDAPPLSPLLPLRRQPQSFDTPLSMLGHVPKTFFHDEGTLNFILSLSQLSFDTPDEELSHIFRNFEEQKVVFQGIQHRQTLFLQSVAQSIDAGILLQEERGDHPYLPQDFLLCEESTKVGDTVFYSLRSPKLPERQLALRVITNSRLCLRIYAGKMLLLFVCGGAAAPQSRFSLSSGFLLVCPVMDW